MAATRPPRAPAKKIQEPIVNKATLLTLLFLGLALAAYNLALMTTTAGDLSGLTQSWETLQMNYATPRNAYVPVEKPVVATEPTPVILASVVKYREGEEALLQQDLIAPIISYDEVTAGPRLKAMLIERKNASSKDVSVRLFYVDGTESSYLWPSSNSSNGRWTPPCAPTAGTVTEDLPLCPERFQKASLIP